MPLREYGCPCGETKERLESSNCTQEPPRCDKCGDVMERIMSAAAFRLFGPGFYKQSSRT